MSMSGRGNLISLIMGRDYEQRGGRTTDGLAVDWVSWVGGHHTLQPDLLISLLSCGIKGVSFQLGWYFDLPCNPLGSRHLQPISIFPACSPGHSGPLWTSPVFCPRYSLAPVKLFLRTVLSTQIKFPNMVTTYFPYKVDVFWLLMVRNSASDAEM